MAMRSLLACLAVLMLSACEQNGRYQISALGSGVWRLDTRTGELVVCGVGLGGSGTKINCVSSF